MIGILEKGFTRIPIYQDMDKKKIVAVLNVKDLILIDPHDKKQVADVLEEVNDFKNVCLNDPKILYLFVRILDNNNGNSIRFTGNAGTRSHE